MFISNYLELLGISLEFLGALYAISNKFPILWKIIKKTWPFKQIDKGLEKLDPINYDIPLSDRRLDNSDEGFKEIFHIINERFGPYGKEFDTMYFTEKSRTRTKETSIYSLLLRKFNNGINYDEYPTTRHDLLLRIDFWKERELVVRGFIFILLGVILQLIGIYGSSANV